MTQWQVTLPLSGSDFYQLKSRVLETRTSVFPILNRQSSDAGYLPLLALPKLLLENLSIHRASSVALLVKNPPANAGDDTRDVGSIPGLGRSPGEGNGNLLQYSCLENSMERGA